MYKFENHSSSSDKDLIHKELQFNLKIIRDLYNALMWLNKKKLYFFDINFKTIFYYIKHDGLRLDFREDIKVFLGSINKIYGEKYYEKKKKQFYKRTSENYNFNIWYIVSLSFLGLNLFYEEEILDFDYLRKGEIKKSKQQQFNEFDDFMNEMTTSNDNDEQKTVFEFYKNNISELIELKKTGELEKDTYQTGILPPSIQKYIDDFNKKLNELIK